MTAYFSVLICGFPIYPPILINLVPKFLVLKNLQLLPFKGCIPFKLEHIIFKMYLHGFFFSLKVCLISNESSDLLFDLFIDSYHHLTVFENVFFMLWNIGFLIQSNLYWASTCTSENLWIIRVLRWMGSLGGYIGFVHTIGCAQVSMWSGQVLGEIL